MKAIQNEAELLTRISFGDEEAFTDLFRAYHNSLGAFVMTLIQSPEMTEEIVHDVFVKIWMDRGSLPGIENFTSYLFIITRNYTLNHIRKITSQKRQLKEYFNDTGNLIILPEYGTEAEPDYLALIASAVEKLPSQQKKVFVLRSDGLKNPEIAERMGISVDSVKKYQQLALRSVSEFVKVQKILPLILLSYYFK